MHPEWSDEELYQETRRIVVAEMQHITYNEFLPIVLGKPYMDRAEMSPKDSGYTALYDRELNPGITNAFATAAFRFGHTLLVSNLQYAFTFRLHCIPSAALAATRTSIV